MNVPEQFQEIFAGYQRQGFGERVGFGRRPALIVIDMIRAFTDPSSPLGAPMEAQLEAIRKLLQIARPRCLPVYFLAVAYDDGLRDAGVWSRKISSLSWLAAGSKWVEVDPSLGRREDEAVIVKKYASAFFGTDLVSRLVSRGVDTVLLTGCTASGCIRATAVDACSYGFHTIVVDEAVGDRAELPRLANLFDIDAKYGDVVSLEDAIDYLTDAKNASAR